MKTVVMRVNPMAGSMASNEPNRRDAVRRAAFIHAILTHVVHGSTVHFTIETVQHLLNVAPDTADRILQRLESVELMHQTRRGVWVRVIPAPHFGPRLL
jgi:hypothetical protein